MKTMKKTWALVLAVVMALALAIPAYAATDTTINATNVGEGDSVVYYQVVRWVDGQGWVINDAFKDIEGISIDVLTTENGITDALAAAIADAASGDGTAMTPDQEDGTTFSATVDPGMYYLKATPSEDHPDTVYNPAFVSADYEEGGNTVDFSTALSNTAVLKSSTIELEKEVTGSDQFKDTKIGDIIPYQITTQVPSYGDTFTNPTFSITDTFSSGLELKIDESHPFTVTYGENTVTTEDIDENEDVTFTGVEDGASSYTVAFEKDYLTGLAGNQPTVTITYYGVVTTQALDNATYMNNKAVLTYSNTPSTVDTKDDITRHYTFSLDANLNGGNHGNEKTRELIKIGVDENGEEITAFTSWVEGEEWTEYSPLAGASFQLVGNGETYTAESDGDGYISFKGLDAGTYTLTETAAPTGYVRDTNEYTVVITPTYQEGTDILTGYTVTVDGNESSYTIENMSDTASTIETTVDATSQTFPFVNTKGQELPSTGGIGTKIFYTMGAVLVIGAGVVLVSRKRAGE